MQPRTILAIARKDAIDVLHNRATVGGLLSPIFMALMFLVISKLVGSSTTNVLVYNPGDSKVVQTALASLQNAKITKAASAEEVSTAFVPPAGSKSGPYAIGLIVPASFDSALASGAMPGIAVYLDDSTLNVQAQAAIQASIRNYALAVVHPQPPVNLVVTVINPSPSEDAGVILKGIYIPIVLLGSLVIGTTFIPQLLIEEKEKKTLRMLMVTPASFEDVLIGKMIVVLVYQLILTAVVLAIEGSYTGQIGLILVYVFLGGCFSVSMGLVFGAAFNTVSAATASASPLIILYVVGGIFVGQLGDVLGGSSLFVRLARFLPTYYIAEGVYNASQSLGTFGGNLLDIGIILGTTLLLLAISAWILRRTASVAGTI